MGALNTQNLSCPAKAALTQTLVSLICRRIRSALQCFFRSVTAAVVNSSFLALPMRTTMNQGCLSASHSSGRVCWSSKPALDTCFCIMLGAPSPSDKLGNSTPCSDTADIRPPFWMEVARLQDMEKGITLKAGSLSLRMARHTSE